MRNQSISVAQTHEGSRGEEPTRHSPSQCPICHQQRLRLVYTFGGFQVIKCVSCDNAWRSNMYTEEKVVQLYCESDYDQHPYFHYDLHEVENLAKPRYRNFERALIQIEQKIGTGKLLDVACGSGAFLAIAKGRGWDVQGLELSSPLAAATERNAKVSVVNAAFEEAILPAHSYDVVTFWDIIEHVLDPVYCINKAKSLLRPGGIALFCTPDEQSLLARTGRALYVGSRGRFSGPALALHPSLHTFFFSRRSLSDTLTQQDMTVFRTYSQEAHYDHSPLASNVEKAAISVIERLAGLLDARYETVVLAKT